MKKEISAAIALGLFAAGCAMTPPPPKVVPAEEYVRKVRNGGFTSERKAHRESTSAWTPATHLVLGLNESVSMLREEGLENVFARHRALSSAARAGLRALGYEAVAPSHASPAVTGFFPSAPLDAEVLRKAVRERHGVGLAGGQAGWTGKILRIGHMGWCDRFDVLAAIGAIELEIARLAPGITETGRGVASALASFGAGDGR